MIDIDRSLPNVCQTLPASQNIKCKSSTDLDERELYTYKYILTFDEDHQLCITHFTTQHNQRIYRSITLFLVTLPDKGNAT